MTTQNIHKDIRNVFTAGPITNANNKGMIEKFYTVILVEDYCIIILI